MRGALSGEEDVDRILFLSPPLPFAPAKICIDLRWKDQGWGHRKGRFWVRVLRSKKKIEADSHGSHECHNYVPGGANGNGGEQIQDSFKPHAAVPEHNDSSHEEEEKTEPEREQERLPPSPLSEPLPFALDFADHEFRDDAVVLTGMLVPFPTPATS